MEKDVSLFEIPQKARLSAVFFCPAAYISPAPHMIKQKRKNGGSHEHTHV